MDGVTILTEHTVSNLTASGIFFTILLTALALMLLCLAHDGGGCLFWTIGTATIIVAFLSWCAVWYGATTSHTEYTVTIDDTVSYNEFTKTYEIVSEEDGIYRVKLKEADQ